MSREHQGGTYAQWTEQDGQAVALNAQMLVVTEVGGVLGVDAPGAVVAGAFVRSGGGVLGIETTLTTGLLAMRVGSSDVGIVE
jgi:hypothetical protein